MLQSKQKQSENKIQVILLPCDEISWHYEKKVKVKLKKDDKNKPIILSRSFFQLW